MKKSFVRSIGLIIATLMIVTMIPVTTFADHTTEGAPNIFSVVTTDEGDYTQKEFLLIETLTQNDQTYYGLMIRKSINTHYGTIRYPDVMNLDLVEDTTQTSTDTVKYMNFVLRKIVSENGANKGINGANMNTLVDVLYPDEMLPYIATLEHKITDKDGITYKTVDNITIPTFEQLTANKNYVRLQENSSNPSWSGTWTRDKHTGWQPDFKWLKAMTASGTVAYGQLGSQYDYYFLMPVIYVTADFFENVKIDTTKEVGADIKALLAGKYYQKELAHLGYTAEDFEILTVPLHPEVLTPEWSPNYVKTSDGSLELLYNDTKVVDGETYVGFTVAKDFSSGTTRIGANFVEVTKDKDGNDLPVDTYGTYTFTSTSSGAYKDTGVNISDYVKETLPASIQNNLLLNTWSGGSNYWLNTKINPIKAASIIEYITLPAGTDMINHGPYLKTQMDDNANPYQSGLVTYKGAMTRDHNAYGSRLYNPETQTVVATGIPTAYSYGSLFPTFYVNVDFMKSLKLDVDTMSDTVKALFTANFVRNDLDSLYTEAELDEIGVESFTAEVKPSTAGASFTVGDTTFILMNTTREINGTKYIGVLSKSRLENWANYRFLMKIADENVNDLKVDICYTDVYDGIYPGDTSKLKSINTHSTKFAAFGDAIAPATTEWAMYSGTPAAGAYANKSITINHVGSVGLPTQAEILDVVKYDTITVNVGQSNGLAQRALYYHNGGFGVSVLDANGTGVANVGINSTNQELLNTWKYNGLCYYFMTYVKADWFKTADLDMSSTGTYAHEILRKHFTRADLSAWSEANLSVLFDGSYSGNGIGLIAYKTADGANVVINNNGTAPAGGGSLLVVAGYSEDGLEASTLVPLAGNIPANSYTSKIPVTLETGEGVQLTEIKVMLWDNIDNMKPLANIVTLK